MSDEQRRQPRGPRRVFSNAVGWRRDAPPGSYVTNYAVGTLSQGGGLYPLARREAVNAHCAIWEVRQHCVSEHRSRLTADIVTATTAMRVRLVLDTFQA